MGQDIKSCPIFGSIYISFRLRSTPVGSKPTSTGCCEPLLNACHWHAAASNARYDERLETLKKSMVSGFFCVCEFEFEPVTSCDKEIWWLLFKGNIPRGVLP